MFIFNYIYDNYIFHSFSSKKSYQTEIKLISKGKYLHRKRGVNLKEGKLTLHNNKRDEEIGGGGGFNSASISM